MQDERTVGRPMRDDILQTPRDAFPAQQGISDNDPESRENAGAEMPRVCRPPRHPKQAARPTASWTCRRLRDFLVYDAVDPPNKRVIAYRPIRNA